MFSISDGKKSSQREIKLPGEKINLPDEKIVLNVTNIQVIYFAKAWKLFWADQNSMAAYEGNMTPAVRN